MLAEHVKTTNNRFREYQLCTGQVTPNIAKSIYVHYNSISKMYDKYKN